MPGNQRNQRTQRNPRKKRKYKKWKEPEKKKERRWKSQYVVGTKEWIEEVYQIKPKSGHVFGGHKPILDK